MHALHCLPLSVWCHPTLNTLDILQSSSAKSETADEHWKFIVRSLGQTVEVEEIQAAQQLTITPNDTNTRNSILAQYWP